MCIPIPWSCEHLLSTWCYHDGKSNESHEGAYDESAKGFIFLCMCVFARARVRARVYVSVCVFQNMETPLAANFVIVWGVILVSVSSICDACAAERD